MNIFSYLFGIFRQSGLVSTVKDGKSLTGFGVTSIIFSIIGCALYGFAMGAGLGLETGIKDAAKMALIVILGLLFSIPIFWVSYRLLGREERFAQVAAIPLTLSATVSVILAITSPVVFMLSVLAGFSPDAVYIHIVIIDLAMLVGLYLAGMLIYHGFSDHKRLIPPNVVGFLMMGVIIVVLMTFLSPFLSLRPTFSVGTDRLKDGLGIGVAEKANQALAAAISADRVSYIFQTTNENGDLIQDYTVTLAGDDYLIDVHLHAIPGETLRNEKRIWVLDGQAYTDFEDGSINQTTIVDLVSFLKPALSPAVFSLPPEFASAAWRGYESGSVYTIIGTNQSMGQVTLVLDASTGRLSELTLGSSEKGLHAEVGVKNLVQAAFDRAALETSLNKAIVVGSVDRSDASMKDYIQDDTFFVVRYPRSWSSGTWSSSGQQVEFKHSCGSSEGCPALTLSVFDLVEGKGSKQYADDLGKSLSLQPQYREVEVSTTILDGKIVGVVEYLFDRTVKGEIETSYHIEYIFEGQIHRYHLDFSTPENQIETYRELFEGIAGSFTFLGGSSK